MAVADYADFLAKLASPYQSLQMNKNSGTIIAGRHTSLWTFSPFPGSAPTTAAVPTMATAGAIDPLVRVANPSGDAFLARAEFAQQSNAREGTLILCDRLSHQGGLSGTVTTADVTTNLPTAALTRYTSGVGVLAAIEIYSAIGSTSTTITCKYTNQAGTGGQVSQPIVIGNTGFQEANRFMPISLAAGDTGVRAVTSSTLLASTLTAGAFGYTLYRPLAAFPQWPGTGTDWIGGLTCGNLVEIVDDACLFWILASSSTSSGIISGKVTLIEA